MPLTKHKDGWSIFEPLHVRWHKRWREYDVALAAWEAAVLTHAARRTQKAAFAALKAALLARAVADDALTNIKVWLAREGYYVAGGVVDSEAIRQAQAADGRETEARQ